MPRTPATTGPEERSQRREFTVSVVIPAFGGSPYIAETLDSVFAQTRPATEVILVNDGSPDTEELEAALKPYLERICYIKAKHGGPACARNHGIRHASGEWLALLDEDDLWMPEFLATQLDRLESNPELDLVYANMLLFGDTRFAGRTTMRLAPSTRPVTLQSLIEQKCTVFTSTVVVRRQAIVDAGMFDRTFLGTDDFDMWLRLASRGCQMDFTPGPIAKRRLHGANLGGDTPRMLRSALKVFDKLRRTANLPQSLLAGIDRTEKRLLKRIHIEEGRSFLKQGRYAEATEAFRSAYALKATPKLRLLLIMLGICPTLARQFARLWVALLVGRASARLQRRGSAI